MKKIIAALLTLVMAAVPAGSAYCSGADSIGEETGQDVSEMIDEETDYSTGTPWICSMIDGTVTADTPADPKDDFYLSVNKEKMLSTVLPEDKSETDAFSDIDEKVSKELKDMFLPCISHRKTGYASGKALPAAAAAKQPAQHMERRG